jgi:hypothetical protein
MANIEISKLNLITGNFAVSYFVDTEFQSLPVRFDSKTVHKNAEIWKNLQFALSISAFSLVVVSNLK